MQVPKVSEGRRWRLGVGVTLVVLALFVVAAALGSTSGTKSAGSTKASKKGGYGEVYKADPKILAKTLFKATLLPPPGMSRNIALAAYGRASKKVNFNLALKCWKNDGCKTGTNGKLTVAYVEPFGENVYRHISKMEFILQALTYKSIGRIIYKSAHSNPTQALTDFRAVISQGADAIVSYPDFGDAAIPVFREATRRHIPVVTYAWGYVTGPGKNYTAVVGENVCKLGRAYAKIMNKYVKSGEIAFMGGFPGNPLSAGWQKCERPALNKSIKVVASEPTNWDASKVQQVVSGILAAHPKIKGWSYEYGLGMAQGAFQAYKAAGKPFNAVLTLRTDDVGMGCKTRALKNPKLKVYYYTAGNSQIRVALTAAMMKLKGAKIPPKIVFPIQLQSEAKRTECVKGYPQEASATSLVPLKLLHRMYP
ncbi:MAG TPA: substrate-binding domain-containing protein [Candidatus Binatia bacterium]|jgi:ribose transport system substrate-binding protein|nr:substrate-binding domain-containing protein [Candidatus Binatia bacterium]HWN73789.1 substrate-binding domain-containing protein [Solirubrobacterales bacterium]